MERISLPSRTVATRTIVIVAVVSVVIVLMLAWVAEALYLRAAHTNYMHDFREVVMTRRNLQTYSGDELGSEWTLFQEGGKQHALRSKAEQAFRRMDFWSADMRYVFARGAWREHNATGTAERSAVTADQLQGLADEGLRGAIRNDPMNRFYRQTYAELLIAFKNPALQGEIDRLVALYPPQDAYGEIRAAELLNEVPGVDKRQVRDHYCRALELVSTEYQAGLVDMNAVEAGAALPQALGPAYAERAVDGLLKTGDYATWGASLGDFPDVHWVVGLILRSRNNNADADKEFQAVVDSCNRRLAEQRKVSKLRSLVEILLPLPRSGHINRFLMNREIGEAASVLRSTNRPDEAIDLYRIQVARMPGNVRARLDLGETLVEQAVALAAKARNYRDAGDVAKSDEANARVKAMYQEVDEQASAVLQQDPLSADALALRARVPGRGGELPTP
jgi:hypothetical protein